MTQKKQNAGIPGLDPEAIKKLDEQLNAIDAPFNWDDRLKERGRVILCALAKAELIRQAQRSSNLYVDPDGLDTYKVATMLMYHENQTHIIEILDQLLETLDEISQRI